MSHGITPRDLHEALHDTEHLSHHQRESLQSRFIHPGHGGVVDKFQFRRELKSMLHEGHEGLTSFEIRQAHRSLSDLLDKHIGGDHHQQEHAAAPEKEHPSVTADDHEPQ